MAHFEFDLVGRRHCLADLEAEGVTKALAQAQNRFLHRVFGQVQLSRYLDVGEVVLLASDEILELVEPRATSGLGVFAAESAQGVFEDGESPGRS